jgi:hypothetical protein
VPLVEKEKEEEGEGEGGINDEDNAEGNAVGNDLMRQCNTILGEIKALAAKDRDLLETGSTAFMRYTHTHTYTYTHSIILHSYIHSNIHSYIHSYIHSFIHTQLSTRIPRAYVLVHIPLRIT